MFEILAVILASATAALICARTFLKPTVEEKSRVHECSMMGHDYQPAYDEVSTASEISFTLPKAGPFMNDSQIVKIAQAQAQAIANTPKQRTYVHSVCRYCGLTVDRPVK